MRNRACRVFIFCLLLLFHHASLATQQLIIEPEAGPAPLLTAIQQAKSSVDLVMYGLTDMQFVDALMQAEARHKTVKVLLQQSPYNAADENQKAIAALTSAHLNLRWPDPQFKLTHQKTLLIDDHAALIMTFNLTHGSFSKERNFALWVTDPAMVQEIKTVFNADWQHTTATVHSPDLIWSPDNSRVRLLTLIQHAQTEIEIYAESVNDYQIVGALAKAARAGVNITLLTSAYSDKPASKALKYLAKNGVKIFYSKDYVIHAKVMIIDGALAVLGSINMTRQSIDDNRELAIITRDPQVIRALSHTFEADLQHASTVITVPAMKPDSMHALLKTAKQLAWMTKQNHFHHRRHHAHHRTKGFVT